MVELIYEIVYKFEDLCFILGTSPNFSPTQDHIKTESNLGSRPKTKEACDIFIYLFIYMNLSVNYWMNVNYKDGCDRDNRYRVCQIKRYCIDLDDVIYAWFERSLAWWLNHMVFSTSLKQWKSTYTINHQHDLHLYVGRKIFYTGWNFRLVFAYKQFGRRDLQFTRVSHTVCSCR